MKRAYEYILDPSRQADGPLHPKREFDLNTFNYRCIRSKHTEDSFVKYVDAKPPSR